MKKTIKIEGVEYMNTSDMAQIWNLKLRTVAEYCRTGKIKRCRKESNRWLIPVDAIKPLSDDVIHELLVCVLRLKNDPTEKIDLSLFDMDIENIELIYRYLAEHNYIYRFDISEKNKIPYDVMLTKKGMQKATEYKKRKKSINFQEEIKAWLPIMIASAQFLLQASSIA